MAVIRKSAKIKRLKLKYNKIYPFFLKKKDLQEKEKVIREIILKE